MEQRADYVLHVQTTKRDRDLYNIILVRFQCTEGSWVGAGIEVGG